MPKNLSEILRQANEIKKGIDELEKPERDFLAMSPDEQWAIMVVKWDEQNEEVQQAEGRAKKELAARIEEQCHLIADLLLQITQETIALLPEKTGTDYNIPLDKQALVDFILNAPHVDNEVTDIAMRIVRALLATNEEIMLKHLYARTDGHLVNGRWDGISLNLKTASGRYFNFLTEANSSGDTGERRSESHLFFDPGSEVMENDDMVVLREESRKIRANFDKRTHRLDMMSAHIVIAVAVQHCILLSRGMEVDED